MTPTGSNRSDPDSTDESDRRALAALVVDNPDLARLEILVDRFNILEALGVVRRELSHSHFLAFLLDPSQPHGLGPTFATRLLQVVLGEHRGSDLPVTSLDLDLWNLGGLIVEREWCNIDILLADEGHRLVVLIENKIDTTEHSDQLARYWSVALRRYPGWHMYGIYLTPTGDRPSHDGYMPVSYTTVCEVIENVLAESGRVWDNEVRILLRHYNQMLRRHIVGDSDVTELVRKLYREHPQACDLIYRHRQQRPNTVLRAVVELIKSERRVILDGNHSVEYSRFVVRDWDMPVLQQGSGWTRSGRMVLFTFANIAASLHLRLYIGPGDRAIRERLLGMALGNQPPFAVADEQAPEYTRIYNRPFLTPAEYLGASDVEIRRAMRTQWQEFWDSDFPEMDAVIQSEPWFQ